jgi:hypothetical protein
LQAYYFGESYILVENEYIYGIELGEGRTRMKHKLEEAKESSGQNGMGNTI